MKKPKILILDEATAALDTASEAIVQAAIDTLLASREHTCIVIAHRLSTIWGADKIVFIADGKVLEQGTHEGLIATPNGRYKRLFNSSRRDTTVTLVSLRLSKITDIKGVIDNEGDEEIASAAKLEGDAKAFSGKRARALASPDQGYMLDGSIGAVMAGSVFPLWGGVVCSNHNSPFSPRRGLSRSQWKYP